MLRTTEMSGFFGHKSIFSCFFICILIDLSFLGVRPSMHTLSILEFSCIRMFFSLSLVPKDLFLYTLTP